MMSFYIRILLVHILVFQSLLSNRCLGQNSTDYYFSSVATTPQTFNITEVTTTKNATVEQVTTYDEMTSQPQDGMTSQPQDGMTSQPQDGMTSQPQDGMTSQDETTDWPLEPSPTMDYGMYATDFETITELYYISSITPELESSQLTDTTNFITQHFESTITTDHVKSTADLSSLIPDIQTSSLLLPDTTLFKIPASSVIAPSSSIVSVSPTLITTSPQQTNKPEGPTQAVTDYKFSMRMDGNCNNVKRDEYVFKQACINAITERTRVDKDQIMIDKILCGSIILEFTFYDRSSDDRGAEMLEMASDEEPLIIRFDGNEYYVVEVEQVIPTTVTPDDGGLSIEDQRLLIYIIAGSLCGFVIILAIGVCLCQSCRNRVKKRDKDISFQAEHLTKLSDINLTTTIIPRPKSIYANVGDYETRCSLFAITNNYYYYNNGAFMYDEETQPNGDITSNDDGVMLAVEVNEPTTPGAKASEQFGMSGIPEWKLPQLEGVVRAGSEVEAGSDTASVHEFSRPSSRTFSVPFPPPPPPLPPNQDATVTDIVLPVPQLNRQSDAFSEITDSSGDTNMLLRGGSKRKEKQGLDNGGLQIDENASRENTLTRNRPGSQLASYEALSRL